MNIEQFLEEYNEIDINVLEREQLENFRAIFFEHGYIEKALEISEIIYGRYPDDENAVVSYADNLMHLDRKDDALLVLYSAQTTAQTLLLEGLIYKYDMLFDVAEEKFKQARNLVVDDKDLENIVNYELSLILAETGRDEEALSINYNIYNNEKNPYTFKNVYDNLIELGRFEDAIEFYKTEGKDYDLAEIHFALAYAYSQIHDLEKSKEELLRTIELDNDFVDAYMHLGYMSGVEEAIKYFEKYIELQGFSRNVYLQLTQLFKETEQYDKIRNLVRSLLAERGIDQDTLYISINALRNLYEYEKVYEIYKEHSIIKEEGELLVLTLDTLAQEDDYLDVVISEIKDNHMFLRDVGMYNYLLETVYEATGDLVIKSYLDDIIENSY